MEEELKYDIKESNTNELKEYLDLNNIYYKSNSKKDELITKVIKSLEPEKSNFEKSNLKYYEDHEIYQKMNHKNTFYYNKKYYCVLDNNDYEKKKLTIKIIEIEKEENKDIYQLELNEERYGNIFNSKQYIFLITPKNNIIKIDFLNKKHEIKNNDNLLLLKKSFISIKDDTLYFYLINIQIHNRFYNNINEFKLIKNENINNIF
jgi:hypothetical protein